jgi:hypothetical protein
MTPKDLANQMGIGKHGIPAGDLKDQQRCPICAQPVTKHDILIMDKLSRREFQISGMCQACQDEVFRPEGSHDA